MATWQRPQLIPLEKLNAAAGGLCVTSAEYMCGACAVSVSYTPSGGGG